MSWMAVAVVGSAVVGGVVSSKNSKKQADATREANAAQIEANQVDPRITAMLFGDGTQSLKPGVAPTWGEPDQYGRQTSTNAQTDYTTNNGLLGQYRDLANKPQSAAMQLAGQNAGDYLTQYGMSDMNTMRNGALQQMGGTQAPTMQATQMQAPLIGSVPMAQQVQLDLSGLAGLKNSARAPSAPTVQAATVNGPSQNGLDLKPAYESMIYGEFGANPYLTGAIKKATNQSANAFSDMQADANRSMTEMILPQLRGGAILSGQYGGTRQGIAEGRAVAEHAKEQARALERANQYNTDAAMAAQAQAYREDADRAAALMQSLGGEQYGVAKTNAANAQAASGQNAANQMQVNLANASMDQQGLLSYYERAMQTAMTNAGLSQATNLANQNAILGVGQNNQQTQMATNANNMNSANSAAGNNLQSQLSTNQLNSQNLGAGMAGLGGLLGNAYANAGAQDQYGMNQAIQGNSLLAPYLSKSGTPTQLQPVYNNSGAAALGGAMAGAGMASQLGGLFGNNGYSNKSFGDVPAAQTYTPAFTQSIDYNSLRNQALNY